MRWGNNALAALTAARRKGGVKWNVRAAPFRLADVTPFLLETKRNFGVWAVGGGGAGQCGIDIARDAGGRDLHPGGGAGRGGGHVSALRVCAPVGT